MNIQDYISSGIVESYVLGLSDAAERAEFERMCAAHEEVRAARDAFEIELERQAFANAIEPPQLVKSKIFAELAIDPDATTPKETGTTRLYNATPVGGKVVNWMRYMVAVCLILLLGSTGLNFYLFRQYKDYSARYADLLARNSEVVFNSNVMNATLQSYESAMAIMNDTNVTIVRMPGTNVKTSPDPSSFATVYWDKRTNEVHLRVNNMPRTATDKQYQLWALVDGKPVDAGVFDANTSTVLVKMKNITQAQAFAITLEKRGGSEAPTMEQLYVLGNVKT